ncbi:hypothetical protein ATCC90586_006018 [Pythium insidiosum]|nr:hypothetical protein ATCC90586_006018 [Pythium insidiosum]
MASSDRRHLLVELELDESLFGRRTRRQASVVDLPRQRPQSASSARRATAADAHKGPRLTQTHRAASPFKLQQRVLSSRSRRALDVEGPAASSSCSSAELIVAAIRDNMAARQSVLSDLDTALSLPMVTARGVLSLSLSAQCVKLLNRLRGLTLSIIEMVQFFESQPVTAAAGWTGVRHEFTQYLLRIAASDVDALVRFPVLTAAFDALGVSVVRNPLLDGVTLDASELLLCSCQRLSAASSASASSSASSLTQLVLHRLEAFALRVRREFPAWQVLPHDRVAAALLVLLDLETKHNASRLLPSYLRPDGSAFSGARAGRRASLAWADAEEEEEEETAVGQEELERPSSAMVAPVAAAVLVAEPKRHSVAASPQRSSKKSKAPSLERHATVASLSPMVRETKDVVVAEPRHVPPHQEHREPAIVDVPDAATTMAAVAVTEATQASARSPALETQTTPPRSPRLLPPLPVEEIRETPRTSARPSEPQHSAASDAPGEDDGFEMFDASSILAEIAGALRSLPQFDTDELSPSVESPDVASPSSEITDNHDNAPFTLSTPLDETSSDSPLVGEERPDLEQLGASVGQPPEEEEEKGEEKEAAEEELPSTALSFSPRSVSSLSFACLEEQPPSGSASEPKRHSVAASPQRSSKKSKAPSLERHATVASLSPMVRETKDVVVAEPRHVPPHQEHREPAIVDVADALTTMAAVAVTEATQTSARSPALETQRSPPISPRLLPPLPVEEIRETPRSSARPSEPQHSAASDAPGEDDGFEMFDASGILAEIAGALRSLPQFDNNELSPSVERPDVASPSSEIKDNHDNASFTLSTPLDETSSDSPLVEEERPDPEQLGASVGQPPEEEEENGEEKEAAEEELPSTALSFSPRSVSSLSFACLEEQPPSGSACSSPDLARILALCRDVQLAAVDLTQRLHYDSTPASPSASASPSAPRRPAPLSTRFLESELKMLRRYVRSWRSVVLETRFAVESLRLLNAQRRVARVLSRCLHRRSRERRAELERLRARAASCVQRAWRLVLQRRRERQASDAFHRQHRAFRRCQFFQRLQQRRRRRVGATQTLVRWWRGVLRFRRAQERRNALQEQQRARRDRAALRLQNVLGEHALRAQLARERAVASEQRECLAARLRDEERRRQELDAKRRQELQELQRQWQQADDERQRLHREKRRLLASQARADARRRRRDAARTIAQFLERGVLRRRLAIAEQRCASSERAVHDLETLQAARRAREARRHAESALQASVLRWQVARGREAQRRLEAEREAQQRREARARIARFVAHHVERRRWRLRLQAARVAAATQQIAAFVLHAALSQRLSRQQAAAQARASTLEREKLEALAAERTQATEQLQAQRRAQHGTLLQLWVRSHWQQRQQERARELEARARVAMAAIEAEQRAVEAAAAQHVRLQVRQNLLTLQRRKSERKTQQLSVKHARETRVARVTRVLSECVTDVQHSRRLAAVERQAADQREQQSRGRVALVETLLASKFLAEESAGHAMQRALRGVRELLELAATAGAARRLRRRRIERRVATHWREFAVARRAVVQITQHALWPTDETQEEVAALRELRVSEERRRALRLYELRCIASARKVQRCWRAWRVRLRRLRRQAVKAEEDRLVTAVKLARYSSSRRLLLPVEHREEDEKKAEENEKKAEEKNEKKAEEEDEKKAAEEKKEEATDTEEQTTEEDKPTSEAAKVEQRETLRDANEETQEPREDAATAKACESEERKTESSEAEPKAFETVARQEDTPSCALVPAAVPEAVDVQRSAERRHAAASTLQRWSRRCVSRRRGRIHVRVVHTDGVAFALSFAGGRAVLLATTGQSFRLDRSATRHLLLVLSADDACHPPGDRLRVVHELVADVASLSLSSRSPSASRSARVVDVDELELPRFTALSRQLAKTRSIHRRKLLLDARADAVAIGPQPPAPSSSSSASISSPLTIFDAVESGSVEDAQFLLRQGADLAAREPVAARSALHMLAFCGERVAQRVAMLEFLVSRAGLSLAAPDAHGESPVVLFAAAGQLELLRRALLQLGGDWRSTSARGRTPLHAACEQDQAEVAAALHAIAVASSQQREGVDVLAELHRRDQCGRTPLHVLVERGFVESARQLLAAEPDVARRRRLVLELWDGGGCSPLARAVGRCHLEMVETLLQQSGGLSPSQSQSQSQSLGRDCRGRALLHHAVLAAAGRTRGHRDGDDDLLDLLSLLADAGADLEAADERGDTALHYAALGGHTSVLRHLLALGAEPLVLNSDAELPAQVAAAQGHHDCYRLLLASGHASSSSSSSRNSDLQGVGVGFSHAPSAASYYHPSGPALPTRARPSDEPGRYWDELHREVQLVDESGHFSSEDDGDEGDGDREEEEEEEEEEDRVGGE